jgi:hypothetical protein
LNIRGGDLVLDQRPGEGDAEVALWPPPPMAAEISGGKQTERS